MVDFNEDNVLADSVTDDLEPAMRNGHLKLYRSSGLQYWHCCIAKNTAHMLPDPSFDVVCNVDGDNILTVEFVELASVMVRGMSCLVA